MKKNLRIIFMGTPEFAVPSLGILIKNGYNIVGVVTSPDKPSGRWQEIRQSAIKIYAIANNLYILQPEKLKDPAFHQQLRELKADLQIIVAFRILPDAVWTMPPSGTFNLHASLLPNYRGAAPINWVVINGEKETGITTFFLKHEVDTGDIIFQEKVAIREDETAGELHDKLMNSGAKLVLKTVKAIENNTFQKTDQFTLYSDQDKFKPAPKIYKEFCKIDWNKNIKDIYNHIRGLSPYPGAWTEIVSPEGKRFLLKIFKSTNEEAVHKNDIGNIVTDGKKIIKISAQNGFIILLNLQLSGKKRLEVNEFLRGTKIDSSWRCI
ncbi:MAG: methionyl-tRNA formyltransferase [Bacteroidota bacterium]